MREAALDIHMHNTYTERMTMVYPVHKYVVIKTVMRCLRLPHGRKRDRSVIKRAIQRIKCLV